MRTTSGALLAHEPRITTEEIDLHARAVAVCEAVTKRASVRQNLRGIGLQQRLHTLLRASGCRGLERAGEEMVDLFNAGATEDELHRYVEFLAQLCDDLFVGTSRSDRGALEVAEAQANAREDVLSIQARWQGETPVVLEERADALDRQAAVSRALGRTLRGEARAKRAGRDSALERLGVAPPAA
jgi:hypothetical protein